MGNIYIYIELNHSTTKISVANSYLTKKPLDNIAFTNLVLIALNLFFFFLRKTSDD
jgi:hypothetical protein